MAGAAGTRDKGILGPSTRTLRGGPGPDLSQLKSPIQTSLSGTRQVIHAMECGTGEVKEVLLEEINLMYECKTCFAVFRSLANLIAHKRTFCKGRYKDVHHIYRDKYHDGSPPPPPDLQTVVIEAEPVECVVEESDINLNNYAPSMELLKTSGLLQDISNKPSINRLLPPRKKGLRQIVNKLKAKHEGRDQSYYDNHQRVAASNGEASASNDLERVSQTQVVHLEPMYETDSGLMQSWRYSQDGETLGQTYRAWQEAEADKKCYKVWPNGKVTSSQEAIKLVNGPDGKLYSVRVPIEDFASVDDLDDVDEEQGYTKYPCPYCKKTFSRIMNVFQHMVKVHDMEMHEAKAMRKVIQNRSVYVEGRRKKTKSKEWFERPVKPVLVKVKNFTLESKVPVNLCDKLDTPGNKTCPILSTHCLSDSTKVEHRDPEKADELNRLVAIRDEREKEDEDLDEEVDKKIMQYVDRRRIRCKINNEEFSRLYLLRNHIANVHLQLKRWKCPDCDFGTWMKYQCVNHMIMEHRYKSIESANQRVILRTKEEYFDDNPLVKVDLLDPNRPSTPAEEEDADEDSKKPPHQNGIVNESEDVDDKDTQETPVIDLESDGETNNVEENGSPASGSRSRSNSLSPPDPEDGGKRKRSSTNLARYNVKRTKSGEQEDTAQKDTSSLKIVFSKVRSIQ